MSVTFTYSSDEITLPNPTFGNSIELNHVLTLRRNLTGDPRSYVKRSTKRKFNMTFDNIYIVERTVVVGVETVTLSSSLADIQTFFNSNITNIITFVDHDTNTWIGYVTDDPIEYVENRHNSNDNCVIDEETVSMATYSFTLNFLCEESGE